MSSSQGCGCGKPRASSCETEFQYAVKIVCGTVGAAGAAPGPLAPGQYFTAVNIHNPSKCDIVVFRWKIAEAGIGKPGTVTAFTTLRLGPDQAIELDCPQFSQFFPNFVFLKGYLVIESPEELDVVAVYTGSTVLQVPVNTFHTERVPARCVPVCEDLVLPLSTGVAAWQTVLLPSGIDPATPVVPQIPPNPAWNPAPFGSVWVSNAAGDHVNAPGGVYLYQLCFELCSGFSNPVMQLEGIADNGGVVLLNGTALGPTAVFSSPPLLIPNNPALFRAGTNCLQVRVTNAPGNPSPTGFAIGGLLRVTKGKCPCSPLPILEPPTFTTVPPGGISGNAEPNPGGEQN